MYWPLCLLIIYRRFPSLPIASYHSLCFLSLSTAPFYSTPIPSHRFISPTVASYPSPTASYHSNHASYHCPPPLSTPHLSPPTASYHHPSLPIPLPPLLINPHRVLSLFNEFYHPHRFLSLSAAFFIFCPPLPITPHRFLSLPTASYPSPPLPVTFFRFLFFPTSYYL